jgi:hypothetical protein
MNRELSLVCAVVAVIAASSTTASAAWSGKETTKDGVSQVVSPATPSEGASTVTPKQAWQAGGDDEEDVLFGVVSAVDIDERGNVYALDMQLSQVSVFAPDGKLLRTIGREGEGPGEFRRANIMFLTPEGNVAVLQQMPGKVVLLTPDGKPAADFQGPKGADGGMIGYFEAARAGDAVALSTRQFTQSQGKFSVTRELLVVDKTGATRATIFHDQSAQDMASMMNLDEKEMRKLVWAAGRDGRVYVSDNFDAYAINVYSPSGKLERVISREYAHRTRSKDEMETNKPRVMMRGAGGQRMQPTIKSSETDRDILRILVRDDGSLWVLSSKGGNSQPKGTMASFDVFDPAGHFVKTLALQVPGDFKQDEFHIVRDQLVVVRSARSARDAFMGGDEEKSAPDADMEPVSLVAYRFDAPATAKK